MSEKNELSRNVVVGNISIAWCERKRAWIDFHGKEIKQKVRAAECARRVVKILAYQESLA